MRTNIVIDDKLMEEALKFTGAKSKKEAVEIGLKTIVRLKKQIFVGFVGLVRFLCTTG